jgi:hypothetical protein
MLHATRCEVRLWYCRRVRRWKSDLEADWWSGTTRPTLLSYSWILGEHRFTLFIAAHLMRYPQNIRVGGLRARG